jgi:hypothetical protein
LRFHKDFRKEKDELSMKRLIPFLLVAALGFAAGALTIVRQLAAQHIRELEAQRAAWGAEKNGLETDLASARARRARSSPGVVSVAPATPAEAKPTPEELLRRLAAMKVVPGPERTRAVRQILVMLDQLSEAGPEALPAIRQFLDSHADLEFDRLAEARVPRDIRALTDAVLPLSLRLALFDVIREIGGDEAERLLAETLARTGRGLEIACLTQLLEEMAPGIAITHWLPRKRCSMAGELTGYSAIISSASCVVSTTSHSSARRRRSWCRPTAALTAARYVTCSNRSANRAWQSPRNSTTIAASPRPTAANHWRAWR